METTYQNLWHAGKAVLREKFYNYKPIHFFKRILNKQPNFKPQRNRRRINLTQIYQEDGNNKDYSRNK